MKKCIIIYIIGLLLLWKGISLIIENNKLQNRCTEETVANIYLKKENVNFLSVYHPSTYVFHNVIEYKAGDQVIMSENIDVNDTSTYKLFDSINILYNPNNYYEYVIKDDISKIITESIYIFFSLTFLIIGILFTIRNKFFYKRKKG